MQKGFDVKRAILSTVLVSAITLVVLGLAGCGEEMAKIEEKHNNLQTKVETNTQQIAALGRRIEQNQQQMLASFEDVQNGVRNVAANTSAVSEEQVKLQEAMRNNSRQTTGKINLLEQNQNDLQAGIKEVRDNTQNVAADMAADITSIRDEHASLYDTVQSNSRQFANSLAVIEQNQQQWQSRVDELQQNFQEVTTQISALGGDLLKLQEVLQSNIRELVSTMDLSSKEQLKFQEKIRSDLLAFDNSISAIKQSQEKLQNQIEYVQKSAEILSSELPAAIEQLREQVTRNSSTETEENQPSPETNSVE
jgi:chromosome segregation ATPase